jgi:GcrA cell cycle regulator
MSWTEERVALLKKLWGEGKTAAEIAKELGGVTRNAVIGKAHRLKLSNRLSPIQQNNKKPVAPAANVSAPIEKPVQKRVKKTVAPPSDEDIEGVSLSELKEKMCRWPIGDPKEPGFRFCGCNAIPGLPYCAEHAKVAYQAATRNRVLQAEDFEEKQTKDDDSEKEVAVA